MSSHCLLTPPRASFLFTAGIQPVIIKKNSIVVTAHWVYLEWQLGQLWPQYRLREYFVDIIKGTVEELPSLHNYTIHSSSLNITDLSPHTNYSVAVSYSVTTNNHVVITSPLSDVLHLTTPLAGEMVLF